MPRLPRLDLPGMPVHVTQRGVNRGAIFRDDEDRHHFRRLLGDACATHGVAVHAFVLMDNHVHLLLTPTRPGDLCRTMRAVGQNHAQAFNSRHRRSGPLWQGRFKSCLVDSERYLLTVIRYIELNPVRAAMVAAAQDYRWSSVHTHLGLARDPLLTPHACYDALGRDPPARQIVYRGWLEAGITQEEIAAIRLHLAQERALGDRRFQQMLETTLNRPVACRPRGRPRKTTLCEG